MPEAPRPPLPPFSFDDNGYMATRFASINDLRIGPDDRKFLWPSGEPRPLEHPGLSELGL